jgi:hypothetical protein
MRVLSPLAEACGRQLEIPVALPLGARDALLTETGAHAALRVCA